MPNNITKMCLVCLDRTGSNMISSRLDTHPNIAFYNELFHRQFTIFSDDRVSGAPELIARRDRSPSAFVSSIWDGEYEPKDQRDALRGVGFKLFLNHNAEALRYVINSDAKIVFLRRRNALARFSSFKIAGATNEWKRTKGEAGGQHKIVFHPSEFRAYVQNYMSLETMFEMVLNRWNRHYFDLKYEDFVSRPEVWEGMVQYLGFAPEDFGTSPLLKQNTSDILARFSNPDTVKEFVSSINRADWLSE